MATARIGEACDVRRCSLCRCVNWGADSNEERTTTVLEFSLAKPFDIHVIREAERVETDISDISLCVLGCRQEWNRLGHFGAECRDRHGLDDKKRE